MARNDRITIAERPRGCALLHWAEPAPYVPCHIPILRSPACAIFLILDVDSPKTDCPRQSACWCPDSDHRRPRTEPLLRGQGSVRGKPSVSLPNPYRGADDCRRAHIIPIDRCLRHSSDSYAPDHPRSSAALWHLLSGTRHTRGYSSCFTSISKPHCVRAQKSRHRVSTDTFLCPAASAVSSAPNSTVVGVPFSLSTSVNSLAAASAGALATLATQPFDVMKTKMQVRSETMYHGLWSTVRAVWQVGSRILDRPYWNGSLSICSSIAGWPAFSTVRPFECLERYSAQQLVGLCMRECS